MRVDAAQRRLLLALGASALLHVWLAQSDPDAGIPRIKVGGTAALRVSLREPPVDFLTQDAVSRSMPATGQESTSTKLALTGNADTLLSADRAVTQPEQAAMTGNAALTRSADPTYYTALSLDVYPQAVVKPDLGSYFADSTAHVANDVRATVLIDESGRVNEVRDIRAATVEAATATRELLLRTRFTPARKDGQVVKAQVQISLGNSASLPH